jgi:hypothetical protein
MFKPISRQEMRNLKCQVDEEIRIEKIQTILRDIYNTVTNYARSNTNTTYEYKVPHPQEKSPDRYTNEFYIKNMIEILTNLEKLFPDCSVSHSVLGRGRDGKLYDLSKLDDRTIPLVTNVLANSYIVIDWT